MNNNRICDSLIRESAIRVRESMLASYPAPENCQHEFSEEFDIKIRKLIIGIQKNRNRRRASLAAAVLAVTLLGSFIWLINCTEAYADFSKWIREIYESSIIYRYFNFEGKDADRDYTFGWLPEGYSIFKTVQQFNSTAIFAQNEAGELIILTYQKTVDGMELAISGAQAIEVTSVNGEYAEFVYDPDPYSFNILIWSDGQYSFYVDSLLDLEETVRIAENIKTVVIRKKDVS